eukprot:4632334-Amphidinium_carterae.1
MWLWLASACKMLSRTGCTAVTIITDSLQVVGLSSDFVILAGCGLRTLAEFMFFPARYVGQVGDNCSGDRLFLWGRWWCIIQYVFRMGASFHLHQLDLVLGVGRRWLMCVD